MPVNVALTVGVAVVGALLVGFVQWKTEVLAGERGDEQVSGPTLCVTHGRGDGAHPDVISRDWEREPLLREGEGRAYGS